MRWEFTDVEFKALCYKYRGGRLPSPLRFTSTTRYLDDYERELIECHAKLDAELGPGFATIFDTVAQPDVALVVHAWCDGEFDNPRKRIRVHGARRDRRACLIVQAPGETVFHSGGFTMLECEPEELPALMLAYLPPTEEARGPAVTLVTEQPEPDPYGGSGAFDSFEDSAETRSAAFWNRPAELTGAIRVLQGRSMFGPRGMHQVTMIFRDLPADGRYLIEVGAPEMTARGADMKQIISRFEQHVEQTLLLMESRGEIEV
ncbi:ESX secretion-associated protein EspG [Nocardia concava]|uniref:ESX secretion-associated protein EspG n=1 Tax=Nocardia concava TaxID=257281 RepID=UPI0002DE2FD1|nr:ESX secretion-associated protein EspG [Nocardia concava]